MIIKCAQNLIFIYMYIFYSFWRGSVKFLCWKEARSSVREADWCSGESWPGLGSLEALCSDRECPGDPRVQCPGQSCKRFIGEVV